MVTSSYPKYPGDVTAPFIESITRGVERRGHRVDVVLPFHPDLRRSADEPVRFFPYRYAPTDALCLWGYAQSLEADVRVRREIYLLAPFVALALRNTVGQRLRSDRYDVVHVHWLVPNAAMIFDVAGAYGVPLVVSVHGSDVFMAERSALPRALARRALARAGAVTACSGDLHRRLVALGAPASRVRTVPYGVDSSEFAPGDRSGRGRWGATADEVLVLAFGRMVEKKGFRYLIEAVAKVPGVRLMVAGDGDLRAALEARARELRAPAVFPGSLERRELAAAVVAADVVVVPSIVDDAGNVDGLPNSLLEALSAGRAVVATEVAGIPDVIENEVNGLLVPQKDPAALATAVSRLAADSGLRARLGGEARRRARLSLTWEKAAEAFEECYVQAATLDAR
jgi:glycosyltransferase involved in cell wall biosynthesis